MFTTAQVVNTAVMNTTAQVVFITPSPSLSVLQIHALTLVIIAYWCLACIKDLEVVAFWFC